MGRRIEVVPYDPAWADQFRRECKWIKKQLGRNCMAVYHIGSTAVEGMWAKPTVDILVTVKDLNKVSALNGYDSFGENGISGRLFFVKGGDVHEFHVHVYDKDDQVNIQRHLAVVEYLNNNERKREEYSQLKAYLAQAYPEDPEGYWEGKRYYVAQLEQEALSNRTESPQEEEEARSPAISLGMCFGLVLGLTVFDNIGIGLCVGLALALALSKFKGK